MCEDTRDLFVCRMISPLLTFCICWWLVNKSTGDDGLPVSFSVVDYGIERKTEAWFAFRYSFPLIWLKQQMGWMYTIDDQQRTQAVFDRSRVYIKDVRETLLSDAAIFSLEYKCMFYNNRVRCTVTHTKDAVCILILGFYGKVKDDSIVYDASVQTIYAYSDGKRLNTLVDSGNFTLLLRDYAKMYSMWKTLHTRLLLESTTSEVSATIHAIDNEYPTVTCVVKSAIPVRFKIRVKTAGVASVVADSRIEDNAHASLVNQINGRTFVAYATMPLRVRGTVIVFCDVESELGWKATFTGTLIETMTDKQKNDGIHMIFVNKTQSSIFPWIDDRDVTVPIDESHAGEHVQASKDRPALILGLAAGGLFLTICVVTYMQRRTTLPCPLVC